MPVTKVGTLGPFRGSWQSGLATLEVDGVPIPCESGPTGRALGGCFDAIGEAHTINSAKFVGREVVYSVDDFGLLLGFTPVEDWVGPEIPEEGICEEPCCEG